MLSTDNLKASEALLRRAHRVLAWLMVYYIHTQPEDAQRIIPRAITIPLLRVCQQLLLPPTITYSDNILYNWAFIHPPNPEAPPSEQKCFGPPSSLPTASPTIPVLYNIRCLETFTGTRDEEEFYLTSARVELRGVEALIIMRQITDDILIGGDKALRRITSYLHKLSPVIKDLAQLLADVRKGCDPEVFFHQIRPWYNGQDSSPTMVKWIFEGIGEDPTFVQPTELSGPSAGQSALICALDLFLGVSHGDDPTSEPVRWLKRMRTYYMPRHHRDFLRYLEANPRPLKALVEANRDYPGLLDAYNASVESLKGFRNIHVWIVATYIVGPARRNAERLGRTLEGVVKGTSGTDSLGFVKSTRNNTSASKL